MTVIKESLGVCETLKNEVVYLFKKIHNSEDMNCNLSLLQTEVLQLAENLSSKTFQLIV